MRIFVTLSILIIIASAANAQEFIECPPKPPRHRIDSSPLQIQWSGEKISFSLLWKAIHFEAGDTTLQKMHESVQILNTILRTLTSQYNGCLIDEEEYLSATNKAFKNAETEGQRIQELAKKILDLQATLDAQKNDKTQPQKSLDIANALKSSNEELRTKLHRYFQQTETIWTAPHQLDINPAVLG